jgi:hypothetical protein
VQQSVEAAEARLKEELSKQEKRLRDKLKVQLDNSREKIKADHERKLSEAKKKFLREIEEAEAKQSKQTEAALEELRRKLEYEKVSEFLSVSISVTKFSDTFLPYNFGQISSEQYRKRSLKINIIYQYLVTLKNHIHLPVSLQLALIQFCA